MKNLKFYAYLLITCLTLTIIFHYTFLQLNFTQGLQFMIRFLSQTKTLMREISPNRRLQNSTEILSEDYQTSLSGRLSVTSNTVSNSNTTDTSHWCNSCVNYHQYKALIYPKHIPNTYLDMVMFIPSQQGDTSFQRRQFLRKFPLNSTLSSQVKFRHVFVFGKYSKFYALFLFIIFHFIFFQKIVIVAEI